MVAIVAGEALGLSLGSLSTFGELGGLAGGMAGAGGLLGAGAQRGADGERAYVNVATGNLVLQRTDDNLAGGLGEPGGPGGLQAVRTYNSQGLLDDTQAWRIGILGQRVQLVEGAAGVPGSRLVRTDRDGAQASYHWDATRRLYASAAGADIEDTLTLAAGGREWTWRDGASGRTERYQVGGDGRLLGAADPDGHTLTLAYERDGRVRSVTQSNGDAFHYDYLGERLVQIRSSAAGIHHTRVRYTYDPLGRLASVTTDLSPQDNSIADGHSLTTRYTYDGTSSRIASVRSDDGSALSVTYRQIDGQWRVASLTDALGATTRFDYDLLARRTTVTDPLGARSTWRYDPQGRLLAQRSGIDAAHPDGLLALDYTYDPQGRLVRATDARGATVLQRTYDPQGRILSETDGLGQQRQRSYNAAHQVLTDTLQRPPGPGGALAQTATTRHVYAAARPTQLRFQIDPEGGVTEYRYDLQGQRVARIVYPQARYPIGALAPQQAPDEAQLLAWSRAQDPRLTLRTDYTWDPRGLLASERAYLAVGADGSGLAAGAAVTTYTHDRHGRLLQRLDAGARVATTFAYDSLGREIARTEAALDASDPAASASATTLTSWEDALGRRTVRQADGQILETTFDAAGRILSVIQRSAQEPRAALGTTTYRYDPAGRLRMRQAPDGAREHYLYDPAGRQIASLGPDGALVETVYDARGLVLRQIAYASRLDTAALLDAQGSLRAELTLDALRPPPSADDRSAWNLYDPAGQRLAQIDGAGHLSRFQYDPAGRLVTTVRYAQPLEPARRDPATLEALAARLADPRDPLGQGGPVAAQALLDALGVIADPLADRASHRIFDAAGRLIGQLDAEGYLQETRHDAAGRERAHIAYAQRALRPEDPDSAQRIAQAQAGHRLDLLRPAADPADSHSLYIHDALGRLVGHIDPEGYLTETRWDLAGRLAETRRYAHRVGVLPALPSAFAGGPAASAEQQLAALRPRADVQDHVSRQSWNDAGLLLSETAPDGTVTRHRYDAGGRRLATTVADGTAEARTTRWRYDAQGRLVGELGAQAAAAVTGGATDAIDGALLQTAWARHAITYTVDAAGRRTSRTDALGARTLYFYDPAGRLAYTVNPLGEVTQHLYDAFGQLAEQIQYGARLDLGALPTAAPAGDPAAPALPAPSAIAQAVAALARPGHDRHSRQTFDAAGALLATIDPLGQRTTYLRNAFGEALAEHQLLASGGARATAWTYDRRGAILATVQDPQGLALTRRSAFDAFGRQLAATDATGATRHYGYDRLGRLVSQQDPLGARQTGTWDAFGRQLSRTDALGHTTTWAWDTAARRFTLTTPEGLQIVTELDRHGQRVRLADSGGAETRWSYDRDGRLVQTRQRAALPPGTVADPANPAEHVDTQRYDLAGRLVETIDPAGVRTVLHYDAADRLLQRTVDPGGLALTTRWQFDAFGQIASTTDPLGTVTRHEHDLAGRLVRETIDPDGLALVSTTQYDSDGRVLATTDAAGTLTRRDYDTAGRLVAEHIDPAGLDLTRRWAHDPEGRIVWDSDPSGAATLYGHDAAGRLRFTLDAAGGLTERAYDAKGRLVAERAYPIALDPATLAAWSAAARAGTGLQEAQLRARLPALGQPAVRQLRYDRDDRLAYDIDPTGAVVHNRHDAAGRVIERIAYARRIDLADWARQAPEPTGAPPVVADPAHDQRLRTVRDALGQPMWQVDALGAVTAWRYDARGQLIEQRTYANALTPQALAAWDGRSAPPVVADDAHDARLRQGWDAAGRLAWQLDGAGALSRFAYDARGQLVRRTDYRDPIAGDADPASLPVPSATQVLADALGRQIDYLYDAAGRLTHEAAFEGLQEDGIYRLRVVRYERDGAGRELRRAEGGLYAYLSTLGALDRPDPAQRLRLLDDWTFFQRWTQSVRDAAGRLVAAVDPLGGVTRHLLDARGQAILSTRHAQAIAVDSTGATPPLTLQALEAQLQPRPDADRSEARVFDPAGRLAATIDPLGGVTELAYDALGQLRQRTTYATALPPSAWPAALALQNRVPGPAELQGLLAGLRNGALDRIEHFAYDPAGRQSLAVDALGGVRETLHDAFGQPVRDIAYARPIDTRGLGPATALDTLRARLVRDGLNDRVTDRAYDTAGRLAYEVDPLGHVTHTARDALGQPVRTTRHALAIGITRFMGTEPLLTREAIAAAVLAHPQDRITSQQFDPAGRLLARTDALGGVERWTYDALGNALSYTNALGATWNYAYDLAGHQTTEWSPEVDLAVLRQDPQGGLQLDPQAAPRERIRTNQRYDVFGQLIDRTEAVDRPEERRTAYEYDLLGRQVIVHHPGVSAYDAPHDDPARNGAAGPARRVETYEWPTTETVYDTLGNAIASREPGGAWSARTYDRAGRLVHDIDALGFVTTRARNVFGEETALTRHARAIGPVGLDGLDGLNSLNGLNPDTVRAQLAAAGGSADDRTLRTQRDRLGRAIQITEPQAFGFDPALAGPGHSGEFIAGRTTRYTFDAFGDRVEEAVLLDPVAQRWARTAYYHDRLGQQIASVDALGYLTLDAFDALGNRVRHVEHANAVAGWAGVTPLDGWSGLRAAANPPALPQAVAHPRDDRVTVYDYDPLGRLRTETRLHVEIADGVRGAPRLADLVSRNEHDALGRLVRTTDASGATTVTTYDALGRVHSQVQPERLNAIDASVRTPVVTYQRDALGQVAIQTTASDLGPGAELRQELFCYDSRGNLTQHHDAAGVAHYQSFDLRGHLAKQWQTLTDPDGRIQTLWHVWQHDALGQLVAELAPGSAGELLDLAGGEGGLYRTAPRATVTLGTPPGDPSSPGPADPLPATAGRLELDIAQLVQPAGGLVRVEFDYTSHARVLPGDGPDAFTVDTSGWDPNGGPTLYHREPGQDLTQSSGLLTPAAAALGLTLLPEQPAAAVHALRIWQQDPSGQWQLLWQGPPEAADGQRVLIEPTGDPGGAAPVPDAIATQLRYNAFGELVARGQPTGEGQGGALDGEYFDYDAAGRLWRTNAVDGIDRIFLYDLQGRQSAEITSAGAGRSDIDLRTQVWTAQQASALADVRRTDTTRDALGRVLTQALAERRETQGGVSLHAARLDSRILASASPDAAAPGGWAGTNQVALAWPGYLADLGSGDVRVTLQYQLRNADGSAGATASITRQLDAAQAANGATLQWTAGQDGTPPGGIAHITRVTVHKKTLAGAWQPLIDLAGASGRLATALHLAAPAQAIDTGGAATVRLQLRPADVAGQGPETGWVDAPLVAFGDQLRADTRGLAEGRHDYRVLTQLPGQPEQATAHGLLTLAAPPLATIATQMGLNPATQTFEWAGPYSPDTQTLRLRLRGSSDPWIEQPIGQPYPGSPWSVIDLAGLAPASYEYELLWRHAGEPGAYAHASGVITKAPGTPDQWIPGTDPVPASGTPHIDGIYVTPYDSGDGAGPMPAVRVPLPTNPFLTYAFGIRPQGWALPFTQPPMVVNWAAAEAHVLIPIAQTPGVYDYAYAYTQLGVGITQHALGTLVLGFDRSLSLVDTTPPYVPASPGTPGTTIPGTPPTYAWAATPSGPTPLSEDPRLGGLALSQQPALDGTDRWLRPTVHQSLDRWGNILSVSDPRSAQWVTHYRYNAQNRLVEQIQPHADSGLSVVLDAQGQPARVPDLVAVAGAPVTRHTYDALGRLVATVDPLGHIEARDYDAAGQLVRERHADGGVVTHGYDGFGQRTWQQDALGHRTHYRYDPLGRLVQTTYAPVQLHGWANPFAPSLLGTVQLTQTQTWDQAGRLTSQTNGANETTRYTWDLRGNLLATTQPLGQVTRSAYDRFDRKILQQDPNGALATFTYQPQGGRFGLLVAATDPGGTRYRYTYDHARQLLEQTSTRGQHLSHRYDAAGQRIATHDLALDHHTTYRYDLAGRHVRETTTQAGRTYQDNFIAYDTLGRMRWVGDSRATVRIDHDLVGNRKRIAIHLDDLAQQDTERHYQYDAMGRQTVVDALDPQGTLGALGHRLTYDLNGNRTSDTHQAPRVIHDGSQWSVQSGSDQSGSPLTSTETYTYDPLGRLVDTHRDGALVDQRWYDGASRVVQSGSALALDAGYAQADRAARVQSSAAAQRAPLQVRTSRYDPNGRLQQQFIGEITPQGQLRDTAVAYTQYDAAGNLLATLSAEVGGVTQSRTLYTYEPGRQAGYQLRSSLTEVAQVAGADPGLISRGGLQYRHDVNGHLDATLDVANATTPTQRLHRFVHDAQGRVLFADYAHEQAPEQSHDAQRQLIVNGEVLGRYGAMADQRFEALGLQAPVFTAQSEFSFGYRGVQSQSASATATGPASHIVGDGDTLQGIAQAAYGDSRLWYRIAEANGLSSNADLRTGQVLSIPTLLGSANRADSFRPYDPSAIASDSATQMAVPRGQEGGCGGVGQVIVVVVAAVVAFYTAGAALGYLGTAGAGTAGAAGATGAAGAAGAAGTAGAAAGFSGASVVAGAVGGVAGNIAGQTVGLALGVQERFDWKQVAMAGVSGGVGGGLGGYAPTGNAIGDAVIRSALGNTLTQGLSVAAGLQPSFNWRSVAASAAGAGVGQGVGGALNNANAFENLGRAGQGFANGAVSGLAAGTAAAVARGGKVAIQQVATDAFGVAIGSSLAATNGQGSSPPTRQGEGPWSAADYRNGLDVQSDNATLAGDLGLAQDRAMRLAASNPYGLPDVAMPPSIASAPSLADNTRQVFSLENLAAMPSWEIQGAGDPALAQAMMVLQGERHQVTGEWLIPSGSQEIGNALKTVATVRGLALERAQREYQNTVDIIETRELRSYDAGQERVPFDELSSREHRVPLLSLKAANGLPDNSAHMAAIEQLRFGKLVGDSLGGLDPVFGALLSPTGGIPGAGNIRVTSKFAITAAGGLEVITNHGIAHDAAGYLRNYQQIGSGYQYVPNYHGLISTASPLGGQISGLTLYNNLRLYGSAVVPKSKE